MSKYVERNLGKDEQVIYRIKIHWACLIPYIILGIITLPFMGVGFLFMIPTLIRMYTTELGITSKRLIGKVGLINTQSLDSPLNKINNASVSSGLLGKIFGYGDIDVLTSSGAYRYKSVAQPENFRVSLMNQIEKYDEDRIKKQATELAQAMKS